MALMGVIILFVGFLAIDGFYRACKSKLIEINFPYRTEDSCFIPGNYKNTINFIKNTLKADENFYTMTSEAVWYYYINKPCPCRFPVVWFAVPKFYQEQITAQIDRNNVKYIIYRNQNWSNTIDGIQNEERFPIIIKYIEEHYHFYKNIDGNELWIRNQFEENK